MSDEDKDLGLDEDEGTDAADSGSDNSAPPADAKPEDNSEKRINDLMSMAQKAEARAAKAEAALKAAQSGEQAPKDKDVAGAKPASGGDDFVEFARENARNTLFGSDPRLAEYGLTAESIGGETVAEMRASLAAQKKLIDGIESAARNKILREHGLDPEVSTGAATEGAKDFAAMSNEEFKKFLAERDARPR